MRVILIIAALVMQSAPPSAQPGVITGRILTVEGVPAARMRVAALVAEEGVSNPALVSISFTDDSGQYQLKNVPPGRYLIVAGGFDRPTYFPGVPFETQAKPVAVTSGAVAEAIDFRMVLMPSLKVEGRVVHDRSLPQVVSTLIAMSSPLDSFNAVIAPDGSFLFPDVLPGSYQLSFPGGGAIQNGNTVKVTDRDVTGLEVVVVLSSLKIQVSEPAVTQLEVRRQGAAAVLLKARDNDGRFEFIGLPGSYTLAIVFPSSPIPVPDVQFTLPAMPAVDLEIVMPRLRRVLLRTVFDEGGAAPPFILRIEGTVPSAQSGHAAPQGTTRIGTPERKFMGYTIEIVSAPDGTSRIMLPEGRFEFGAGSAEGAAVPLRLKSMKSIQGENLTLEIVLMRR